MDVKLGQLGSWLAMRDFTPSGILGGMRRGEGAAGDARGCGFLIPAPDGAREGSAQESLAAGADVAWGGASGSAGVAPWPVLPSQSSFSRNISFFCL